MTSTGPRPLGMTGSSPCAPIRRPATGGTGNKQDDIDAIMASFD